MKHLAYFLIIILFFCSANPTEGCTIVMVANGKIVLAGNNEDWRNPKTKIWFIPASEELIKVIERQGVEKSLELNPSNENCKEMLKKLDAKK